ncbi:MAG: hypothetical protein IJX98_03065 [Clostridia bacterium]|nr:hypothetical protein [Clostridia bacterium]
MQEEMEYAEMLEIPVSTVNVVKKRGRKTKKTPDLKAEVISKVNDGAPEAQAEEAAATTAATETNETAPQTGETVVETAQETPQTETVESAPVPIPRRKKVSFFARLFGKKKNEWQVDDEVVSETTAETQIEQTEAAEETAASAAAALTMSESAENSNESAPVPVKAQKKDRSSLIFGLEVAAACALCFGIFLTNVFMPTSAINTFFRSLAAEPQETDSRTYADFTLSGVIYDNSAEITVSPTGVLSFTDEGCVYPAVDGTVTEILQESNGTWTVKIAHSPTFSEVISGLSYAPLQAGDSVKSNIPIGYSDGTGEVQMTMYENGELLNCFEVTETGGLAWIVEE